MRHKKEIVKLDYTTPNLINYCLTSGIVFFLTLTNLMEKSYTPCYALGIAFVISSILFWIKPIPQIVKSLLLPLSPALLNMVLVLLDKESTTFFSVMIACMIMGALYYSKNLVIAHAIVINIFSIISIIILNNGLVTIALPASEGYNHLIRMNIAAVILYLLTQRGYHHIYEATKAKHEAEELLLKLNDIMDSTTKTIHLLDEGILATGENVKELGTSSSAVMAATTQMAEGISMQSQSSSEASELANDSIDKMEITKTLSVEAVNTAKAIFAEIEDNLVQVNQMYKEMKNIQDSTEHTYETVITLQSNMEDINQLLNGITGIAEQTNLLSLNASIEAARAGEQGKGFAVVAGEVKKLAAQSHLTASSIVDIVTGINISTNNTLNQVISEKASIENGSQIMDGLLNSYKKMQTGFESLNKEINQESTYINEVVEGYVHIMASVKNIAEISLDHSATAEEICAAIEDQNTHLNRINSQMLSLKEQSAALREKVVM